MVVGNSPDLGIKYKYLGSRGLVISSIIIIIKKVEFTKRLHKTQRILKAEKQKNITRKEALIKIKRFLRFHVLSVDQAWEQHLV